MVSYPVRYIIGLGCFLIFVRNISMGSTLATDNAKEKLKVTYMDPSPPVMHQLPQSSEKRRRKKKANEKEEIKGREGKRTDPSPVERVEITQMRELAPIENTNVFVEGLTIPEDHMHKKVAPHSVLKSSAIMGDLTIPEVSDKPDPASLKRRRKKKGSQKEAIKETNDMRTYSSPVKGVEITQMLEQVPIEKKNVSAAAQLQLPQESERWQVEKKNASLADWNMSTPQYALRALNLHRSVAPQRVLMSTFVFGEKAANLRRLAMFLETASTAGVDFVIIGHPAPPYPLSPNIRHFDITWHQFVDQLVDKVFHGGQHLDPLKVDELKNGSPYKVCDFRPLLAYMFPELVTDYQWWGYMDNDTLVGNLRKLISQSILQKNDLISGASLCHSFGPFMMYRNIPWVNELFLKASQYGGLETIFITSELKMFDEWGRAEGGTLMSPAMRSMSGLIKHHAAGLGLRRHGMKGGMWDYSECQNPEMKKDYGPVPERCAECVYDGSSLVLSRTKKVRFMCHYEGSKDNLERSLEDETKWKQLLSDRKFRVSWEGGFDFVTQASTDGKKIVKRRHGTN